jgi:hypothetical protein
MTEEQAKIDALLTVGINRLLASAAAATRMRDALRYNMPGTSVEASYLLAEHMDIVEHALLEAGNLIQIQYRAQLALQGIAAQHDKHGVPGDRHTSTGCKKGGLIH